MQLISVNKKKSRQLSDQFKSSLRPINPTTIKQRMHVRCYRNLMKTTGAHPWEQQQSNRGGDVSFCLSATGTHNQRVKSWYTDPSPLYGARSCSLTPFAVMATKPCRSCTKKKEGDEERGTDKKEKEGRGGVSGRRVLELWEQEFSCQSNKIMGLKRPGLHGVSTENCQFMFFIPTSAALVQVFTQKAVNCAQCLCWMSPFEERKKQW